MAPRRPILLGDAFRVDRSAGGGLTTTDIPPVASSARASEPGESSSQDNSYPMGYPVVPERNHGGRSR